MCNSKRNGLGSFGLAACCVMAFIWRSMNWLRSRVTISWSWSFGLGNRAVLRDDLGHQRPQIPHRQLREERRPGSSSSVGMGLDAEG
jgi:hypothetical protein